MDSVTAQITIAGQIEDVWEFLTDYDGLARHVTGLARCRLLRSENGYKVVEQVGRPGVPLLPAELVVRLKVVERRPSLISFEQMEGSFSHFQGRWELAEAGATATRVIYELAAKPRGFLPSSLIRPALRRGMDEALHQIKAAIEASCGKVVRA